VIDASFSFVVSFAIFGVPPLGLAAQLRFFVDPDHLQYREVWAAAGTWNDAFAVSPSDLLSATGGAVVDLRCG
jgi:prolyl-tRNA editing enzyme YbaK/EbsC (Cys-tRNA(Pro) deacylase)